jgi:hypothetical protein
MSEEGGRDMILAYETHELSRKRREKVVEKRIDLLCWCCE